MDDSYQVPASNPQPVAAPNPYGGASGVLGEGPAIKYSCGDCNTSVLLKRGDPIRCKECGHRVLYKDRTDRYVFGFFFFDDNGGEEGARWVRRKGIFEEEEERRVA
jgi:DNA-directed RNA polymerase I, II, and III subunit RPABC4